MPTRSIQVKLVVPRGQDGLPLRHSLWATHDAVNAATHFYESHLLLMRGDSYVMGESEIEKTAVINELRALIEAARKRNGVSGGEVDDEAIALLRKLYEHLVPSSVGKNAIKWTRLSCRKFRNNEVRLQLHALAYNLANFMRTLALPTEVEHWSLTTLREKLVKIGAKVVRHGRYVTFQLAEVAVPRSLFQKILALIDDLRRRPVPA